MRPGEQGRREAAGQKAAKQQRNLDQLRWVIEDGDVVILSGIYTGQKATEVFRMGAAERDYIIKELWFTNDADVQEILSPFFCK